MGNNVIIFPTNSKEDVCRVASSMIRVAQLSINHFPQELVDRELLLVNARLMRIRNGSKRQLHEEVIKQLADGLAEEFTGRRCRNCDCFGICPNFIDPSSNLEEAEQGTLYHCHDYKANVDLFRRRSKEYRVLIPLLDDRYRLKLMDNGVPARMSAIFALWAEEVGLNSPAEQI